MLTPRLISIMDARFFQYKLEGTLASGTTEILEKNIQSGFHFWSEFMTMIYTTLHAGAEADEDDGVNRFTVQFKSGANQIGLSNDPIDVALIAAPGRQRAVGFAGDPSNQLHIQGFPWPYLYEASGSIMADTKNNSDAAADQTIKFLWTGFLIPTYKVETPEKFYALLAQEYPEYGGGIPQ